MRKNSKFIKFIYFMFLVLNGLFAFQLFKLNEILPMANYIAVGIQVVLILIFFHGAFKNKSKLTRGLTKLLLIVLSAALAFGNFYIFKYGLVLDGLIGQDTKVDTVSVVVLKESPYDKLSEIKDLDFAIEDEHESIVMEAMKKFDKDVNRIIDTVDAEDYHALAAGLYDGTYEVIVVNEAFRSMIHEEYPEFTKETKVIAEYRKETTIKKSNVDVTKDVFSVMITGIDVFGEISNNARSDVNILAVINPKTKKILLISIPRDYYLPMTCQNDALDKLTHTGIYGVDCTMDTVGRTFDIDIDFYARVNFTSLVTIVDAIGGVDVYNEYYFNVGDQEFFEGHNILSGEEALTFVRDRNNQVDGDSGRGRHQVQVLTSIINKVLSPALITNFNSLLNAVEGSFQTNMSESDINALVRMQLKDMSDWEIIQDQVAGENANDYSFAMGRNQYVMYPDEESVERVRKVIESMNFD